MNISVRLPTQGKVYCWGRQRNAGQRDCPVSSGHHVFWPSSKVFPVDLSTKCSLVQARQMTAS